VDVRPGVAPALDGREVPDDRPVGQLPGELEHPWASRSYVDRHVRPRRLEVEHRVPSGERRPLDRHRLAPQQAVNKADRVAHGRHRRSPLDAERAVIRPAETEHRPAAGELVQRRDPGGEERGMPAVRVRHARAEADARRAEGERGQNAEEVLLQAIIVRPDERAAEALRLPGAGQELLEQRLQRQRDPQLDGSHPSAPRSSRRLR
jgi:hypothetical protein